MSEDKSMPDSQAMPARAADEVPAVNWEAIPSPWRPRFAWVTWGILASTIIVFLFQLHWYHRYHQDVLGDRLAFNGEAWNNGRYWTLVTYAWAHAVSIFGSPGLFWLHIVANMIPLICIGPALEDLLGHVRFLGLYLGSAIASALAWSYFNRDAEQGIIGASGAVFGLVAAVGTAAPRARVVVYLFFLLPVRTNLRIFAITVCGAEIAQIIFGWMPEVAHSAHLGGAAFGFVYLLVMWKTMRNYPVLD